MELSGPERKSSLVSPNVREGSEARRVELETGILFRHKVVGARATKTVGRTSRGKNMRKAAT